MKIVFRVLSVVTAVIGLWDVAEDIAAGNFDWTSVVWLIGMGLLTGLFVFLSWFFDGKSPVTQAAEQTEAIVRQEKEKASAYKGYSPAVKRRIWKFRLLGTGVMALAIWIWVAGNWETLPVSVGTVVLILGLAMFNMGSPADYNAMVDGGGMIAMDKPRKIEEFYAAYKDLPTPLGSGWLGKFSTSAYVSLIFGPDSQGQYLYFYLSGDGNVGYVGYSVLDAAISEQITEPTIPPQEDVGGNLAEHLCFHSDLFLMRDWLQESLEQFVKTGMPLPFRGLEPSEIYTFSEDFKLTGQHFTVEDGEGKVCYTVDGTAPLIKLRVLDDRGTEVFSMTKQLAKALVTYKFYREGALYGTLEKQLDLVRDRFQMEVPEGTLELREYGGTVGHNYKVTLNGRMLGAIMDNMDLTIENVVFDNAFLIVYEKQWLPMLVAMAVMAARELARDRAQEKTL